MKTQNLSPMSRIHPLEPNEAPVLMRPVYWLMQRMFGKVITPIKVQAHRPGIAIIGNMLGQTIERSGTIELRLHKLAQIRAAQLIGCPF